MPVDLQPTASAPRRPFAMWLMVGGSFLISFTGPIIRNMEAVSALHVNFYRAAALFVVFSPLYWHDMVATRLLISCGLGTWIFLLGFVWQLRSCACCRR